MKVIIKAYTITIIITIGILVAAQFAYGAPTSTTIQNLILKNPTSTILSTDANGLVVATTTSAGGGIATSTSGDYAEGNITFFLSTSTVSASSGINFTTSTGQFSIGGNLFVGSSCAVAGEGNCSAVGSYGQLVFNGTAISLGRNTSLQEVSSTPDYFSLASGGGGIQIDDMGGLKIAGVGTSTIVGDGTTSTVGGRFEANLSYLTSFTTTTLPAIAPTGTIWLQDDDNSLNFNYRVPRQGGRFVIGSATGTIISPPATMVFRANNPTGAAGIGYDFQTVNNPNSAAIFRVQDNFNGFVPFTVNGEAAASSTARAVFLVASGGQNYSEIFGAYQGSSFVNLTYGSALGGWASGVKILVQNVGGSGATGIQSYSSYNTISTLNRFMSGGVFGTQYTVGSDFGSRAADYMLGISAAYSAAANGYVIPKVGYFSGLRGTAPVAGISNFVGIALAGAPASTTNAISIAVEDGIAMEANKKFFYNSRLTMPNNGLSNNTTQIFTSYVDGDTYSVFTSSTIGDAVVFTIQGVTTTVQTTSTFQSLVNLVDANNNSYSTSTTWLANGKPFVTTTTIDFQAGANITITTSTSGVYTITGTPTSSFDIVLANPSSTTQVHATGVKRAFPNGGTIMDIRCDDLTTGTSTIYFTENASSAPNTIVSTALRTLSCGIGGNNSSTISDNSIAIGNLLVGVVSSTAGTPDGLHVEVIFR